MPLAGRRPVPRFELAGEPTGMLDALEPLSVRALSRDGMRIESPNPLEVGSIHEFQLIDGTATVRVRAAVRHLFPLPQGSGQRYFLVDLEFLNLTGEPSVEVERWLSGGPARPTRKET